MNNTRRIGLGGRLFSLTFSEWRAIFHRLEVAGKVPESFLAYHWDRGNTPIWTLNKWNRIPEKDRKIWEAAA